MSFSVYYTTQSGQNTFRFLFEEEGGRWHCYVVDTPPFPANYVQASECPPGCERSDGGQRIRWLALTEISSLGQAQSLAAFWAEDIEAFVHTGKWIIPYNTNDGRDDFVFCIERVEDSFRVYVERHPTYGRRDSSSVATHRLGR